MEHFKDQLDKPRQHHQEITQMLEYIESQISIKGKHKQLR